MCAKRSRVHPPYKTKYRLSNSAEYDQALIKHVAASRSGLARLSSRNGVPSPLGSAVARGANSLAE